MDRRNKIPWWMDAACAETDPDMFMPELGSATNAAKRICNTVCTVKAQCLEEALQTNAPGIRGGLTQQQRQTLRRGAA